MDLSILKSAIDTATAVKRETAAKAWSSALTTLITAVIAWVAAYVTGTPDASVSGAMNEAVNNLFLVTVSTVVPAVASYYVTYMIPNKPKG